MNRPRLLLADEPTGRSTRKPEMPCSVCSSSSPSKERITVILATHERRFAEACHRIVRVRDGRLVDV
jgi:lipoprotein-releasing system ATP-binding protein